MPSRLKFAASPSDRLRDMRGGRDALEAVVGALLGGILGAIAGGVVSVVAANHATESGGLEELDGLALVLLGIVAGLVIGAGVGTYVVLRSRRRRRAATTAVVVAGALGAAVFLLFGAGTFGVPSLVLAVLACAVLARLAVQPRAIPREPPPRPDGGEAPR